MKIKWNQNENGPINWWYESEKHCFGGVESILGGKFSAWIPIEYYIDEDGVEHDCKHLGIYSSLKSAQKAVEKKYSLDQFI